MRVPSRFSAVLLLLSVSWSAFAQNTGSANPALPSVAPTAGADVAGTTHTAPAKPTDGAPIDAVSTISSSVTVDAVLLPHSITRRLFGAEIAKRFVAVQMTVSNRSSSAGLILHSAFLDYSQWLFSGNFIAPGLASQPVQTTSYQRQNLPSQVASVEARLVRGDLLDAQTWTTRNWFLRAATLVGTAAAGFQFLTTNADALAGISSYGNQLVPALGVLWPDNTQLQLNRISDFGFQNNHVVPKNSSDTIVAFFPLDRFLTPALQKIYMKAPAAFFVPMEMLLDGKSRDLLLKPLQRMNLVSSDPATASQQVTAALIQYQSCKDTMNCFKSPEQLLLIQVLAKVSLNNIRVVIGGTMTVDVNTVPPTLTSITLADSGSTQAWSGTDSVHKGTLIGNFLSDAEIELAVGKDASYFSSIEVDRPHSTDTKLLFSYKLNTKLPRPALRSRSPPPSTHRTGLRPQARRSKIFWQRTINPAPPPIDLPWGSGRADLQ
jgi:hypothetical protein